MITINAAHLTITGHHDYTDVSVEDTPTPDVLEACQRLAATGQPILFNFWGVSNHSPDNLPLRRSIYGATEGAPGAHPLTTASYTDCEDAVEFHGRMFRAAHGL